MATLIKKIQNDKLASERRIALLEDEIASQENDIRQITAVATAVEMIRLLPEKLEDLKTKIQWFNQEREKQGTLDCYLKSE